MNENMLEILNKKIEVYIEAKDLYDKYMTYEHNWNGWYYA